MAIKSRHKIILDAVAATVNADADLANKFVIRKRAYKRDKTWENGGTIAPATMTPKPLDTHSEELGFQVWIIWADPCDGDLVADMDFHLGCIERIEEIFRGKTGAAMPVTMREGITKTEEGITMTLLRVDVTPQARFHTSAFELGYDASATLLTVWVRAPRRT